MQKGLRSHYIVTLRSKKNDAFNEKLNLQKKNKAQTRLIV